MSCLTIAYGIHIIQGDQQLKSIATPTFGKSKQIKMLERLQINKVETLITMDYEIYGVIEMLDSQMNVIHLGVRSVLRAMTASLKSFKKPKEDTSSYAIQVCR